jgi:hypothetical protein
VETRWNFSMMASGEFAPWDTVSGLVGGGVLLNNPKTKMPMATIATPKSQKYLFRRTDRGSSSKTSAMGSKGTERVLFLGI